jgi:uncharacterized heparinase superfamily protein
LRAANSELAREQAKVLVQDFIALKGSHDPLAWNPEIVGRRVISWLSNSVLVLDTGEPEGYEAFLKALTSHLRYLSAGYRDAPDGVPRLVALMALIYAGLCIAEQQAVVDRYSRHFGKELTDAIDRIMPMLRFFRTGDGTLARFNGAGPTPTDALATVLAYDDIEGAPVRTAANSGYVRLEIGATLIISDLAGAPTSSVSSLAHAGFLSFEMSSNGCPMIVNCGAPSAEYDDWRPFARSTPAHSTLSLEDSSSADFTVGVANGGAPASNSPLLGPLHAQAAFNDQGDNFRIKGFHDGYVSRYGVSHARQMLVPPSGTLVSSEDKLSAPKGLKFYDGPIAGAFAIRFHLHPGVRATLAPDGRSADLTLANGEVWSISTNAPEIAIEDSVFLADARGPQPTTQVVLSGMMGEASEVRIVWNIERTAEGGGGQLVDPNDAASEAA